MHGPTETELIAAMDAALVPAVRSISSVLERAGHGCWAVGGCVRDIALLLAEGRASSVLGDWDLATSAPPSEVMRLFGRVIPTGIQHGTVTIVMDQKHFEVTTLRGERGHSDGRHPDEVFFVSDIRADLARRDFTVNAIAYDIEHQTLHDPFDGLGDLAAGRLRAVGDPLARFSEDGLRVLRCARFCSTLGFDIEAATAQAILPSLDSFKKVAQERVQAEWFKALAGSCPGKFLEVVFQHGLLQVTAPGLFVPGDPWIPVSSAAASLGKLHSTDESSPVPLRLSYLIAAGTPRCPSWIMQIEQAKASARALSSHLKLSRDHTQHILHLVAHHLPPEQLLQAPSPHEARRYVAHLGRIHADEVLLLQAACLDQPGVSISQVQDLHALIREILQSGTPLSLGELCVTGHDLMQHGISRGPLIGQTLKQLLDHVLLHPEDHRRERLLELVRAQQS